MIARPFSFEQAILAPSSTFSRPCDVLELDQLSRALKIKVLESWRLEAHRSLTDPDRITPNVKEFETLQEINLALADLSS